MELITNYLYKVDIKTKSVEKTDFHDSQHLKDYVMNVIHKVTDSVGDREYKFQDTAITMKTWLNKIILQEANKAIREDIANRLLDKETSTQERIEHLGKEIQKGMLMISYAQITANERKVVLSKADYDEFIEEETGELKTGLATKKKIYKAFVANVSLVDGQQTITKMTTYDTNATMAKYWWEDFLELEVIRKNDINTQKAFDTIEKEILNPLQKDHKQDYLYLWNLTLGYFRADGEFNLDYYRDEIIGRYQPFDERVSIDDLKNKCNNLPEKGEFDRRFEKDIKRIKGKKLKKTLVLTNEISLIIKDSIPNMGETLRAFQDNEGKKFLGIRSDSGYEYAERIRPAENV